uniref:Splicing factor 45 n=1 Tax=Microcebus murinus TaxID=30608 RepID=A0A8C5Y095_MICMU
MVSFGDEQSICYYERKISYPLKCEYLILERYFVVACVCLQNMVGAGEVDEDLEVETKEECEKYGKVGKCVIFEIPGAPDDEAVRIFLEFERVESAIKAVVDLNGRYFGGRVVKACFYNLDKFRVLDLA